MLIILRLAKKTAQKIVQGLQDAELDYVEVGFFRNSKKESETTVFTDFDEVEQFLPQTCNIRIFAMIVYGKFDIDKIPLKSQTRIDGLRVTFKKDEIDEALDYIRKIREKGYIVSANPTVVNSYTDEEFLSLISKVNQSGTDIFAVVDTLGVLKSDEIHRLYELSDNNLHPDTILAFHSHNNLQLAFSNAQVLLGLCTTRKLIIDSSVRGMGRSAGNLCTELLIQYLNDNYGKNYHLLPILKIIDEIIQPIYCQYPWGYNVPCYLSAVYNCHPNYASFLTDKAALSVESISEILSSIPDSKKSNYHEDLIQKIYLKFQSARVNDSEVLADLQRRIGKKAVLLLAPGKTILSEKDKITKFIQENDPFIFSLNFRPDDIQVDRVFISNERRFLDQPHLQDVIVTSNIKADDVAKLNYGSYLNNSEMADNSALMLLKVLIKLGIKTVTCAGLDGFKSGNDNYVKTELINNAKLGWDEDRRNSVMDEMLCRFSKKIGIKFITTTIYEIPEAKI